MKIKDTADDAGEWMIDENLFFAYLSSVATGSMPLDISTDVVSLSDFEALTTIHVPIQSSMMLGSNISNADRTVFKVLASHADQNPIFFGRVRPYSAHLVIVKMKTKKHLNSIIMD